MNVRTYVEKVLKLDPKSCEHFTFVINEVMNPERPTRYLVSHKTPIRCWYDWKGTYYYSKEESDILDYIVLNEKQPVTYWLSGANWNPQIESGSLHSLNVISEEEYAKYFGEKEKAPCNWHSIEYIENQILKAHNMTREDIHRASDRVFGL